MLTGDVSTRNVVVDYNQVDTQEQGGEMADPFDMCCGELVLGKPRGVQFRWVDGRCRLQKKL